jgi:hypothetical protein
VSVREREKEIKRAREKEEREKKDKNERRVRKERKTKREKHTQRYKTNKPDQSAKEQHPDNKMVKPKFDLAYRLLTCSG